MEVCKGITTGVLALTSVAGGTEIANAGVEGYYAGLSFGSYQGVLPFYDGSYAIATDVSYGVFAGYNWQLPGNLYGGFEFAVNNGAATSEVGYEDDYGISIMVDVKARVGTMLGDRIFAYGFAGVSGGLMDSNSGGYGIFGGNFGAGVEYDMSDSISVGVEYIGRRMVGHDYSYDYGALDNGTVAVRAIFTF
jgi:opacity protein-like surface antigen